MINLSPCDPLACRGMRCHPPRNTTMGGKMKEISFETPINNHRIIGTQITIKNLLDYPFKILVHGEDGKKQVIEVIEDGEKSLELGTPKMMIDHQNPQKLHMVVTRLDFDRSLRLQSGLLDAITKFVSERIDKPLESISFVQLKDRTSVIFKPGYALMKS